MASRLQCEIFQYSTKVLGKQNPSGCTFKIKSRNNNKPVIRVQEAYN